MKAPCRSNSSPRADRNQFHGGLYETNRNSYFEACYFFNCLAGTAKDRINLNEYGFTIGGPVLKNKLFFFESFEFFDLPQSFGETGNLDDAPGGRRHFHVQRRRGREDGQPVHAGGGGKSVASGGDAGISHGADPTLAKTYSLINQLTSSGGTIISRIATNNDYNRYNFTTAAKAVNNRKFQTARIDYNLNEKHHINFVWNYQVNDRTPDGLNLEYAILPGMGTTLGSQDLEGQYGINWTGSIGVRSVITANIINEFNGGIQGGANALGDGLSPNDYGIWNGNLVSFGAVHDQSI